MQRVGTDFDYFEIYSDHDRFINFSRWSGNLHFLSNGGYEKMKKEYFIDNAFTIMI